MKAALYVRVSTTHQVDKDSLPLQREELINYSKYVLGIDDYVIFEDAGYSGKDTDRPGFQNMMERIRQKEFTHVLVWKIDRISRNLLDFATMYEEMKKYDVTFISKNEQFDTSTAMGEAMLKIILVFAELERKLTAERVRATMLSRAEKGLWNGANVPLGYKWSEEEKFPVIDEDEAPTIEFIFNNYLKYKSATIVMELLNKNGMKTKRGGQWTSKTVTDIIRNPFYKGTYRYNYREGGRGKVKDKKEWIIIENNHPGIIEQELWDECNRIMDKNAEKNTAMFRKNTNIHLFSSLLVCNRCGKGFIANLDQPRKDGFRPSFYRCRTKLLKQPCSSTKIATDVKIAPFVLQYIANLVKSQEKISSKTTARSLEKTLLNSNVFKDVVGINLSGLEDTIISILYSGNKNIELQTDNKVTDIELERLKRDKEKHERALKRLNDLYLYSDDAMSEKDYLLQKKNISDKIEEINLKLKEHHNKNNRSIYDSSFLKAATYFVLNNEFMNKKNINYKKLIMNTDKELVKDFINLVVDNIYIDNGKVAAIKFKNGIVHEFIYKSS